MDERYCETLSVGIIQTTLDNMAAWAANRSPKMSASEERWAIHEIQKFIAGFHQDGMSKSKEEIKKGQSRYDRKREKNYTPDIILMPELSVPRGFIQKLEKISDDIQSIIIAGVDYLVNDNVHKPSVVNQAAIIVPSNWRGKKIYEKPVTRYIGKTYPAPKEDAALKDWKYEFLHSPEVWIFDGGKIGKFGVAICYDLLDLDRLAVYRKKIQHLFILAYNQDTTSFNHAAEAMARMIFCNVVICNCGKYGGSLSVSPYTEVYERTIYHHMGMGLSTSQIISLPVSSLITHQENDVLTGSKFKSLPPGFKKYVMKVARTAAIANLPQKQEGD